MFSRPVKSTVSHGGLADRFRRATTTTGAERVHCAARLADVRVERGGRPTGCIPGRRRAYDVEISTSDAHRAPNTVNRATCAWDPVRRTSSIAWNCLMWHFFPTPCETRRLNGPTDSWGPGTSTSSLFLNPDGSLSLSFHGAGAAATIFESERSVRRFDFTIIFCSVLAVIRQTLFRLVELLKNTLRHHFTH